MDQLQHLGGAGVDAPFAANATVIVDRVNESEGVVRTILKLLLSNPPVLEDGTHRRGYNRDRAEYAEYE